MTRAETTSSTSVQTATALVKAGCATVGRCRHPSPIMTSLERCGLSTRSRRLVPRPVVADAGGVDAALRPADEGDQLRHRVKAADQGAVGEDAAVGDRAVVGDVTAGHEVVAAADLGQPARGRGAAVDGDVLPEHVAVADLQPPLGAVELEVLRPVAEDDAGADV